MTEANACNADRVQYKCKGGALVDVKQDRTVKDCTGGIVWETAFLLATFLEVFVLLCLWECGKDQNAC